MMIPKGCWGRAGMPAPMVAEIAADYRQFGTRETARRHDRSRTTIWLIIRNAGLPLRPRSVRKAGAVCHKGEWFSPDHQGYLRSTTGAAHRAGGARVLQRVIWEEANGPVPPGCLIIFADGDKRNCALENLACKTRSEWRRDPRSHSANGWTVFRREEERLWREIEAAEAAESSLEALPRLTAALDALEAHRQKRPKLSAAHLAKITQAGKACWAAYTAEERAERIRKMRARRWPK